MRRQHGTLARTFGSVNGSRDYRVVGGRGEKHIHDIALAFVLMLLSPLLLSLLFVTSAITAVVVCISHTCVSCPSPLLWLRSLLLTMKLMMVVLALVLMTSRAHSCAARSCDPSVSQWGSKEIARDHQNYDLSLVWT